MLPVMATTRTRSGRKTSHNGWPKPRRVVGSYPVIDIQGAVRVATDGACQHNPGPGGWGWWIDEFTFGSGSKTRSTNNEMELTAILEALRSTSGPVVVETDSQYAADALTSWVTGWRRNGWRTKSGTSVANQDLFETILQEASTRAVAVRWVRGHNGHVGNEHADALATAAATPRACNT